MSWQTQKLETVADFCLGKMLDQKKNRGEPLPYLANVNVRWDEFDLADLREMRFEQHELDRYGLKYGDIVMCEGGAPGRCAIWKEQRSSMMIQKALHRIRPHDCLRPEFLYYFFLYKGRTGHLASLFTGSTIKHLPREKLALVEVPVPPHSTQDQIALVLSAYDDLIENNRRRIQLLEQAARLLYKEWFVHLRFPGHEHTQIIDGVPDGWKVGTIGDLGEVITGKTPSKKKPENFGSDLPFIKTPDMHGNAIVVHTEESLSEEGAKTQANKTLPPRSILVSCIGTVGAVAFNASPAQTNQQINSIVPASDLVTYWAYFMAKELKPLLEGMGGGATMANVNKSKFSGIKVVIPSKQLLNLFSDFAKPVFDQIENLTISNALLAKARDLLLPKLMNGEVAM
jgi:type I restriction enzyme, S subunit